MSKNKAGIHHEVEIKLRVPDRTTLLLRLRELGAREIVPRTHESNSLYDTPSRDLARRGQLIRVRIERPCPNGTRKLSSRTGRALLTYKGPTGLFPVSHSKNHPRGEMARFKVKEEIEVAVGSGDQMTQILRALTFRPVFQYEKFRTTYALPGIANLNIEFDETPVGLFLELEGNPAAIDRAAKRLGYSRADYLTLTYGDLYVADCKRRRRKPSKMLFQPTKKFC